MEEIEWHKVDSSFLDALAHDGEDTMFARMIKGGDEFSHRGISYSEFLAIKDAPSVGAAYRKVSAGGTRI